MKSAHDKIVRLADKLRLTDKTRGLLIKMRKDVLEKVRLNLKAIKNTSQNPWKITLNQEITTGSLDRWTAVEKSSDIDVVVAFNFKPIDGNKKFPTSREAMKKIQSQIPIKKNHPSQILIKRYSALGDIPLEYFGKNDLGLMESNNYLKQNDNDIIKFHKWDIQLPITDTNATTSRIRHKLNYFAKGITTFNFNKP